MGVRLSPAAIKACSFEENKIMLIERDFILPKKIGELTLATPQKSFLRFS
ncbi:MAG: hypothetical protein HYT37_00530 [Candidatus Sungbacteria bacterium]|nr:hypothetical protein [Candidatus Sungbacteria bacterium]